MRLIFFIYWSWYILWEGLKQLPIKPPLWVVENVVRLDYANFLFIPIAFMVIDFVMQDKKDYQFMFYNMASFFARVAIFLFLINEKTVNKDTGMYEAYRNIMPYAIYGFTLIVVVITEKPFIKKAENYYLKNKV